MNQCWPGSPFDFDVGGHGGQHQRIGDEVIQTPAMPSQNNDSLRIACNGRRKGEFEVRCVLCNRMAFQRTPETGEGFVAHTVEVADNEIGFEPEIVGVVES